MSLFFYLYNLFSILIYSISLAICFLTYGCTARKDLRHAGFFMFVCIFDSVYTIAQYLLDFRYSTHALVLTAALALTLVKIYLLGKIIADIFEKDLSPEFIILLCIIVIIHGLFSTSPSDVYWQLDSISFNVSVLIIFGSYLYSFVQEDNAEYRQFAAKYTEIVLIMLTFSAFALLYTVANLSLIQAVLSRSYMDMYTTVFCLILSAWYIVFCRRELKERSDEKMEDVFQQRFHEFQFLEQEESSTPFPDQFTAFCRHYELTGRECEILQLILSGKSNQEISDMLYITVGTVKAHVHSIFGKLDVSRRSQLITRVLDYDPQSVEHHLASLQHK